MFEEIISLELAWILPITAILYFISLKFFYPKIKTKKEKNKETKIGKSQY